MRFHLLLLPALLLTIPLRAADSSRESVEQKFKELDKNGDHLLTPDELPMPKLFKALDLDGDGKVTLEEAIKAAPGAAASAAERPAVAVTAPDLTREGIEQKFNEADKNGDHLLTADEVANPRLFQALDLDGDGKVTLEEAMKAAPKIAAATAAAKRPAAAASAETSPEAVTKQFKDADKNGDHVLSPEEVANPKLFKALDLDGDGQVTLEEAIKAASSAAVRDALSQAPAILPAGPHAVSASDAGIGRRLDDLAFNSPDGKALTLTKATGPNGVVVALQSASCPVSQQYAPSLAQLEGVLREKGIALVQIDAASPAAAALQARSAAEVLLVDPARTLLYRGALDDQFGLDYHKPAPTQNYLLDAVAEMLAGRKVSVAATSAPGTPLEKKAAPSATASITYHDQVQRILQQNCAECHHEGGVGPFSLEDLAAVKDHAKVIRRVVDQGIMPPWFALPADAGQPSPWANDRSLSPESKRELLAWLDSKDRPTGLESDAPRPVKWVQGWSLGEPDVVLAFAKPIDVKAEGTMPYIDVLVPTNLTEDRWVSAVEVQPGARQVVHHVVVTINGSKGGMRGNGGEGSNGYFGLYVPGTSAEVSPAGMAKKLPAGSTLRCQMHYTPNGHATTDTTRIGLYFTKEAPKWEIRTAAAMNNKIVIPAGAANHEETARLDVPANALILSLFPHMHVRGKAFRYELVQPDGTTRPLLEVPRYDFNWQLVYQLATPFVAPPGTTMKVTAWYDNSPANQANPDPTKTVRWGLQTMDEMMVGSLRYAVPIRPPAETAQR